jgi:hypothetical protein
MPRAYGTTNAAPYASAPAVGLAGDTYWNTAQKVLYVSDGTAWNAMAPVVSIAITAPATPQAGQLWWRSDTGRLMIYYNDGSSSQWVPVNLG